MANLLIFRIELHQAYFPPTTHSSHPALSSHLPTPAVYRRTLHIHGLLVFENLSQGLFHPLRTEPSDWLTNKPDTNPRQKKKKKKGRVAVRWGGWMGSPSVTASASTRVGRKHTQDGTASHAYRDETPLYALCPHLTLHLRTARSPLPGLNPAKPPALCLTCLPPRLARERKRARKCGGSVEEELPRSDGSRAR